jgi:hypothetical protein
MGRPMQRSLAEKNRESAEQRSKVAADITAAHEMLWTRPGAAVTPTWFIFADRFMIDNAEYILRVATADKAASELQHSLSGIYLNVSRLLLEVDRTIDPDHRCQGCGAGEVAMSRGPSRFKQRDLTAAVKAVMAAGTQGCSGRSR